MDGYKRLSRPSLSGLSKIKADTLRVTDDVVVDTNTLVVDPDNNRVGICSSSPSYPLDVTGVINTSTGYWIGGTSALSSDTLGSNIVNSSLSSLGTLSALSVTGNVNLGPTGVYKIDSSEVLSSTTLGGTVTGSSLTSVGVLTSLSVSGNVNVDSGSIYLDAVNNRIGVGLTNPSYSIDVRTTANTAQAVCSLTAPNLIANNTVSYYYGKELVDGNYGGQRFYYLSSGNANNRFDTFVGPQPSKTLPASVSCYYSGKVALANSELTVSSSDGVTTKGALSVGGSANVASGNTYKIDGTDVLSATTLGGGVTSSSLTSLGTVSNLKATIIECGGTASANADGSLRFNNVTGEKICLFASSANSHYSMGVGSSSFNFNSNTGSFTFRKEGKNDDGTQILEIDDDTVTFTQPISLPSSLPTLTSSMLGYVETATLGSVINLPAIGTTTTILTITDLPIGVWLLIGQVLLYTADDTVTVTGVDQTLVSNTTTIAGNYDNLDWSLSLTAGRSFNIVTTVALSSATTQHLKMGVTSSGGDTTVKVSNTTTTTYFKAIRIA